MKVVFVFNESKIVDNYLEIKIDWKCPFLPRLGEAINPSILMQKLTPKEFYQSLIEEAKVRWNEWVNKYLDNYNGSIEEAEKGCMSEWLLDMKVCVKEVFWMLMKEVIMSASLLKKPVIFWSKGIGYTSVK